jgi:hypothetical protein
MTDNGSAYRSIAHAAACRALRIRHIRTPPIDPRPTARIERFVRTMLREWGLRRRLRLPPGEGRGPLRVDRPLQLQSMTRRPRIPAADSAATGGDQEQRRRHLLLRRPGGPLGAQSGSAEIRLGLRVHNAYLTYPAHGPPALLRCSPITQPSRLTRESCTDKERHRGATVPSALTDEGREGAGRVTQPALILIGALGSPAAPVEHPCGPTRPNLRRP